MNKNMKEKILEILKEKEASATEIAKTLDTTLSYVYLLLYNLEGRGLVERKRWEGRWLWKYKINK